MHNAGFGVVLDDDMRERIDAKNSIRGLLTELIIRREDDRAVAFSARLKMA